MRIQNPDVLRFFDLDARDSSSGSDDEAEENQDLAGETYYLSLRAFPSE